MQELPASPDAFVWLHLYQVEMKDAIGQTLSIVSVG